MTTVEFGGGPSIEQRRNFLGLKDGTKISGYTGFCPTHKFRNGKTFGQETYELSQAGRRSEGNSQQRNEGGRGGGSAETSRQRNEIPDSTGDNKYTKNMVPGYTGYIPRSLYKFGDTYKHQCDKSIDEHLTNVNKTRWLLYDLNGATRSGTENGRHPVDFDPNVKNHLNTYRDTDPDRPTTVCDRRGSMEPPIPGYVGFVPRIHTTELGVGCRYHEMSRNGLELFARERWNQGPSSSAPFNMNSGGGGRSSGGPRLRSRPSHVGERIYIRDGMMPKYTGFVPQESYQFGKTYADATRSLDVCSHDQPNYGDYIRSKTTI